MTNLPELTYGSRKTRLTSPRSRLTPPRLTRRLGHSLPLSARFSPGAEMPKEPAPREEIHFEPARGDALELYLREIGQVKLITPAEEIVLAKRIKKGDKQAREDMIKA